MLTRLLATIVIGLSASAASLRAGDGCGCIAKAPTCAAASTCAAAPSCGCNTGSACDPGCDPCGNGCGLFSNKCGCPIDGLDRFANCGCNGSYNYPVPPLYTYHWPGMYKQVRMTDYHSPWRFPPLKRYEDEPLPTIEIPAPRAAAGPRLLRPVSLGVAGSAASGKSTWSTEIEPLSSRLSR